MQTGLQRGRGTANRGKDVSIASRVGIVLVANFGRGTKTPPKNACKMVSGVVGSYKSEHYRIVHSFSNPPLHKTMLFSEILMLEMIEPLCIMSISN